MEGLRKLACVVLSVVMVLATCIYSFGAVRSDNKVVDLQYISTDRVVSDIAVSGSSASYYAKFAPKAGQNISYVKATLKLVNSSGTIVKTKTETIYESGGYFKISDSKTLSSKGTYHAEYTLKVYKSGSLVETIKGQSVSATY